MESFLIPKGNQNILAPRRSDSPSGIVPKEFNTGIMVKASFSRMLVITQ